MATGGSQIRPRQQLDDKHNSSAWRLIPSDFDFESPAVARDKLQRAYVRGMQIAFALEALLHNGLQDRLARRVEELLATAPPTTERAIGMHVRRGDACDQYNTTFEAETVGKRRCHPLAHYVAAARRLRQRYGEQHRTILLMTDSTEVTRETAQFSDFEWRFLRYNRSVLGDDEQSNLNLTSRSDKVWNIDRAFLLSKQRDFRTQSNRARNVSNNTAFIPEQVVATMIGDLRFVSEAAMFVGTSSSFASITVQMLMWARHGALPAMVSLSGPPLQTMLKIRGRVVPSVASNGRPHVHPRLFPHSHQATTKRFWWWYPCAYAPSPLRCARGKLYRV